jgi:competence protein ComEC
MPLGPALALGAVGGALVGCLTDVAATDALAASVAACSVSIVVEPWRQRALWRALLVAGVASATMLHGAVARDRAFVRGPGLFSTDSVRVMASIPGVRGPTPSMPAESVENRPGPVELTGTLVRDAEQADGSVGLLVESRDVRDARGARPVRGRVQLYVAGELAGPAAAAWTAGRTVRVTATLRPPRVARNPGGPSPRWQALRRPHLATGSVKSAALVEVERGAIWHEAAAAVRRLVREAAARHVAPHDLQSAAVVTAILIGDRAGLSPVVERRLQAAGTYHVIAISGGNVALLTALCFGVFRAVLRSRRLVAGFTIAVVVAYGGIVGGDPSVLRAVTAACLVLAIHAAGLTPGPIHLISAVALLLVAANPLLVTDVGAWLSFGATLGIVVGAGRLVRWGAARHARRWPLTWRFVVLPLAALLAATICAEVALLPVQAGVFGRVGIAGLALNFVAIPAMACVQVAGLATVALHGAWQGAAPAAGWLAHACAAVLLGSARLVDLAPWLSMRVPPASMVWTAIYYACLVAAATGRLPRRWRAAAAAGLALAAAVILTAPALERAAPPPGVLRVTLVDVGQGDAIFVQFPDRHALLVDTGGSPGAFDVGRRVVTPAAWALGIRRLDWLLVTHPDLDHAGGGPAVVEDLRPREIWEGVAVPPSATRTALVESAARRSIVWRTVRAGHRLEAGGATLEILHPPEPDWERRDVRNDDSVVARLRYGDVEFLLTGDAGLEFESAWRRPPAPAALRVLKAAHHGSRSSSAEPFVAAFRPDLALVSVGQGNFFGHPHPDVLARLGRVRSEVFRTDRDGAIIVETDGRAIDVRGMSGRRFDLRLWPWPS